MSRRPPGMKGLKGSIIQTPINQGYSAAKEEGCLSERRAPSAIKEPFTLTPNYKCTS